VRENEERTPRHIEKVRPEHGDAPEEEYRL
jgi:hypothetical protein